MATQTIPATAENILGIMERDARLLHLHVANPPTNFNPIDLCKHLARMYANAEILVEIAKEMDAARAANANGASEGEEARANG